MIVIMKDGGVTMEVYNKNRDKNNSMHDEIREQNAKLKDAPLKEKLAYFNEYYLKLPSWFSPYSSLWVLLHTPC